MGFTIKDSGKRQEFASGMVRDTTDDKPSFLNVLFGPMLNRWAWHTTKGRTKYPDPKPGVPNWTLAEGVEELLRAQDSALRHMIQWLRGDTDEDHAAAVYFNINLAEYVKEKIELRESIVLPTTPAEHNHLDDQKTPPRCGVLTEAGMRGQMAPCYRAEGHGGRHAA